MPTTKGLDSEDNPAVSFRVQETKERSNARKTSPQRVILSAYATFSLNAVF
jgi:hypothetical protein